MKKKNPLRAIIIVVIIVCAIALLVRNFRVNDLNIVSPGILYTSGQPRGMDYTRLLYKYHIATIINLRSSAEHREQNWYNEEVTWVRSNGVKYVEMPLDRDQGIPNHFPDANMQKQFLDIMADKKNLPVLIHDGKGEDRVAIMAAVWLVKGEKLTAQQVINTFAKIKTAPLVESETNFILGLSK